MCIYIYIYIYIYTHVYIYIYVHAHTYLCYVMYMHYKLYVCMHTHNDDNDDNNNNNNNNNNDNDDNNDDTNDNDIHYVYIYIYIYIYTYIHTYIHNMLTVDRTAWNQVSLLLRSVFESPIWVKTFPGFPLSGGNASLQNTNLLGEPPQITFRILTLRIRTTADFLAEIIYFGARSRGIPVASGGFNSSSTVTFQKCSLEEGAPHLGL